MDKNNIAQAEEYEKVLSRLENTFGDWFNGKMQIPTMTNNLYPYTNMFSPIKVNNCEIKNRLVMGPMGNVNMGDETGRPSQKMIDYFEARAKGGVGLITTGLIPTSFGVDPTVLEKDNLSYFPRIDRSRTNLVGWRNLAYAVHSYGSKIFIQLTAGLGRVGNPECLLTKLKLPVSASWNPNYYIPAIPCKQLSGSGCKKIIKKTGQAAIDAKTAGLDGVYLHGHEGYLLEQMTNPAFNRRILGRYSSYQQFGLDMVSEIRKRCGNKFPIMYRIDLSLMLNATYGDKMKKIKSLKKFRDERLCLETLEYMANLVKAGVDMFDVDLGCYDNWWLPHPPSSMPSGCFLEIAEIAKKYFKDNNIVSNAGLPVPIVAVGKLGYPDFAEQALRDEKCDMIMLARPLLADPEWPNKAFAGKTENIRPCIGCHEACIKEFIEGGHPQCAVCPTTTFETGLLDGLKKANVKKKVAVIGAGPAGVVCAKTLVLRGHDVTLYEKTDRVGGTLNPAAVPKIKYELKNYVDYLTRQVEALKKESNFKAVFGKTVTEEELAKEKFDAIITATGSNQVGLPIKGAVQKHVCTAVEALSDIEKLQNAKNIVVIGGGDSGCELAYFAKYELGKNVTIVEMAPKLMAKSCTANRGHILHYLDKAGVKCYNCASVTSINEDDVEILTNASKTVPNPYNTWEPVLPENIHNPLEKKIKTLPKAVTVEADLVVIAAGTAPNNELYKTLVAKQTAPLIYNVGDSFAPGKVFTAVKSAFNVAKNI